MIKLVDYSLLFSIFKGRANGSLSESMNTTISSPSTITTTTTTTTTTATTRITQEIPDVQIEPSEADLENAEEIYEENIFGENNTPVDPELQFRAESILDGNQGDVSLDLRTSGKYSTYY